MKWIKYVIIVILSTLTNKTVINVFGATYAISGNIVKKLGDNPKSLTDLLKKFTLWMVTW